MKRIATFLLLGWLGLALGGCCGHASWGDKNGWRCHDFDDSNGPRGPSRTD